MKSMPGCRKHGEEKNTQSSQVETLRQASLQSEYPQRKSTLNATTEDESRTRTTNYHPEQDSMRESTRRYARLRIDTAQVAAEKYT